MQKTNNLQEIFLTQGPPGAPEYHGFFDEWLSDAGLCHRV